MEPQEGMFYTKVRVEFNDGSEFVGNEVQASLVSGFTGKYRGGVKRTEFLECVPALSPNVEVSCRSQNDPETESPYSAVGSTAGLGDTVDK